MGKHFELSASSAYRWLACPGSIKLIREAREQGVIPEEDRSSAAANDGTFAHYLAEQCLNKLTAPSEFLGQTLIADKGIKAKVTQDHVDAVNIYCGYIATNTSGSMYVEHKNSLEIKNKQTGGTVDCVLVNDNGTLEIVDFKYGRGVVVEAKNNSQLRIYALQNYFEFNKTVNISKIKLTIVQPRAPHTEGPVRSETLSIKRLLAWYNNVLVRGVENVQMGQPEIKAGKDQCRWCPVAGVCKDSAKNVLKALKKDFKDIEGERLTFQNPNLLTKDEIQTLLNYESVIRKWLDSVKSFALNSAINGEKYDGKKVVQSVGNRAFKHIDNFIMILKRKGVNIDTVMTKPLLCSPAAIEKYLLTQWDKNEVMSLLKRHTLRPERGYKFIDSKMGGKEIVHTIKSDFQEKPHNINREPTCQQTTRHE